MQTLKTGLPDAKVFVSSVPDVKRLWYVGKDSSSARTRLERLGICQSLLANPTVDRPGRRRPPRPGQAAGRRLQHDRSPTACAAYATCRFDHNAVFNYPFALSQVSTWDYFHPNTSGQAALASVTWAQSFWAQ